MANRTIKVRGVVSCAGLWGSLEEGQERELDADIAESLMRAGYAEPLVDPAEGLPPEVVEKKDESAPKKRSKRASAS